MEQQVANEQGSVELITRAEYDVQIATARKYPRSITTFCKEAMGLVKLNEQIADDCIYAIPRDGKIIEGPSARFAEIILHSWGHTRAGARIVDEDAKFITAQGVCHDLQSNTMITFEVKRRITNKKGHRYSDDMIAMTGNAACSIALRNAITRVIPKAFWDPIYQEARKVVMGDSQTLSSRRAAALEHLAKFGATEEMIVKKLGVVGIEDITLDHLLVLRGIATAIKEGDTTIEQLFSEPKSETGSQAAAVEEYLRKHNQGEIEHKPEKTIDVVVDTTDQKQFVGVDLSKGQDETVVSDVIDGEVFPRPMIEITADAPTPEGLAEHEERFAAIIADAPSNEEELEEVVLPEAGEWDGRTVLVGGFPITREFPNVSAAGLLLLNEMKAVKSIVDRRSMYHDNAGLVKALATPEGMKLIEQMTALITTKRKKP